MDYTHLGRSGLRVSRLCLGTMNFGPVTEESDSFAIMDRALAEGIISETAAMRLMDMSGARLRRALREPQPGH